MRCGIAVVTFDFKTPTPRARLTCSFACIGSARGGIVIALATEGDEDIRRKTDHVLYVPACEPLLSPVLASIPLQMLAYYIAVRRGCGVDQPRNLALPGA